jgi:hypothetical protein
MYFASVFFFFQQKVSNQEATQHKKEIHSKISMLEESRDIVKSIRACVPDVIEKSHPGVVQEDKKKGNESQPIEIWKEDLFLFHWSMCRSGVRLHQCPIIL